MNGDKNMLDTVGSVENSNKTKNCNKDRCRISCFTFMALILGAFFVALCWYLCHEIHEVRDAISNVDSQRGPGAETAIIHKPTATPNTLDKDVFLPKLREIEDKIDKMAGSMVQQKTDATASSEFGHVQDAIAEAKSLEAKGDHAMANYYWRNALEHASDSEVLSVLEMYAEASFNVQADDEHRYAEAISLERLAELAIARVLPKETQKAVELRDKCVAFRMELVSKLDHDLEEEENASTEPERHPALVVADQIDLLLKELKESIDKYMPSDRREPPKDLEYKILQLSGVAESSMSQIWFVDRSGLGESDKARIDSFPKRLSDEICRFNDAHDKALLKLIEAHTSGKPPRTYSNHPHQDNIVHYTNNYALASAKARDLRGATAQMSAQESLAKLMQKVSDEKRQQMNEYQKFVANCCKLAYDAMSEMNTGFAGYGRVPKNEGYKNEGDFINRYVRMFSTAVPLAELRGQTDFRQIYTSDNWIPDALQRSTGGPKYWDVHNEHKAFIITAIYGFYRIDQSLLTPETARLFNDVFGKYYEKMDAARKAWSVRWMVEEPKVRLEDF